MHMSRDALDALLKGLQQLRAELKASTDFPVHVLEAAEAAKAAVRLPDKDATHLPLFTIDPPTSKDLDQAMFLERRSGGGYRVHYAIADVAAFVRAGSPLDAEAHDRIETLYFPDLVDGHVIPQGLWSRNSPTPGCRDQLAVGLSTGFLGRLFGR